ncbi:hypothetical protein EVAR_19151_1 [Eumeta japonica]|uniref:Uncharacterized protein n=1 Tax=Eumeta variegata TaxID=151549 RepID=A0A4C1VQ81_EUMVA|nr:hypothetical protein EVAR_19151_1 [Eumeta japonica]
MTQAHLVRKEVPVVTYECVLILQLSRASLGFELLLAMKHHTRQIFITGLQNSSAVVSISVTNLVLSSIHRREQQKHRYCAPYDRNVQAYALSRNSGILKQRHELNAINPTQTLKRCARGEPTLFD